MKPNELRIGNFVNYKDDPRKVYQIRPSGCDFHIGGKAYQSYVWEAIQPVILSDEWFLKFGFEKCTGQYGVYYKSPFDEKVRIYQYGNEWKIGFKRGESFFTICSFIHVHKLQNFHYEFVGEELEIKF